MGCIGGPKHEAVLHAKAREMNSDGWRVVILNGKSPDAVAFKDGKFVAVEVLGRVRKERPPGNYKGKGRWHHTFLKGITLESKKRDYSMFDEVLFAFYQAPDQRHSKTSASTRRILRNG